MYDLKQLLTNLTYKIYLTENIVNNVKNTFQLYY